MPRLLTPALALAAAAWLSTPFAAETADGKTQNSARNTQAQVPDRAEVLAAVKRVASAEVKRIKAVAADPSLAQSVGDNASGNWVTATFTVGTARLSRVADVPDVLAFNREMAARFNYALRGDGSPTSLLNADDQAIGDLFQDIYLRDRTKPGVLMPTKQRLDFLVPYLMKEPAPKRLIWWWCDSLFMAPPVLARMSAITGDPKYLRAMDVQWWRTYDRLWDPTENLIFRDERFIAQRGKNGKKVFWSRGEGWVMGGLSRVLEAMPADFQTRPRYVKMLQDMAGKIASLQQPDGLWRVSLLDAEHYPEPETSGSAFYVYAMAFGINHGLLDRNTYLPHVVKGWAGLAGKIMPSGVLGWVQTTGDQPFAPRPEITMPYGNGAFILAGLEIMKLNDPVTALPLAEPDLSKGVLRVEPGMPRPAADEDHGHAGGDAVAPKEELELRRVSNAASRDLTYNPIVDDPDYVSPIEVRPIGHTPASDNR